MRVGRGIHLSTTLGEPRRPLSLRLPTFSTQRMVMLLFGGLAAIVLLAATLAFVLEYQSTRRYIEQRAEAYAKSMSTDVRWYVEVARQTLNRINDQLAVLNDDGEYQTILSQAITELPVGVRIVVYDKLGISRAYAGLEETPSPISVGDRLYFQQLRQGEPFVISSLITDRLTGTMTFAAGRPLYEDGEFRGAAVAYTPMEILSEVWLSVGGEKSNAFIVHEDGWLTARLPAVDSDVYNRPLPPEFVASFMDAPAGYYWAEASPIDGVERVVGYSKVPQTPLIAVIGISPSVAMSGFWMRIALTFGLLIPVLGMLALAVMRIRSLIMTQEATSARLAHTLERNEHLLLEIHHRIKNNLQSTLSLCRIHVRDPEIISELEPRINAMVAVHEHIYRSSEFTHVPASQYIADIAQKVSFASGDQLCITTNIANVDLPPAMVMPVGQLINEAIINAAKYGANPGIINVRLRVVDGMATLEVTNAVNGRPETFGTGIGHRLMQGFAAQLGGALEMIPTNKDMTVRVSFPLADASE